MSYVFYASKTSVVIPLCHYLKIMILETKTEACILLERVPVAR